MLSPIRKPRFLTLFIVCYLIPVLIVVGMFLVLKKTSLIHIYNDKIFTLPLDASTAQETLKYYGCFEMLFRFIRFFFFMGVLFAIWRKRQNFRELKMIVSQPPPSRSDKSVDQLSYSKCRFQFFLF